MLQHDTCIPSFELTAPSVEWKSQKATGWMSYLANAKKLCAASSASMASSISQFYRPTISHFVTVLGMHAVAKGA